MEEETEGATSEPLFTITRRFDQISIPEEAAANISQEGDELEVTPCDDQLETGEAGATVADETTSADITVTSTKSQAQKDTVSIGPGGDYESAAGTSSATETAEEATPEDTSTRSFLLHEPEHASEVLGQLNEQRLADKFTDLTLCVENAEFRCHRSVLAASGSRYFEAMFSGSLRESSEQSIRLQDLKPRIVKLLIEYSYTSQLHIFPENVQDLLVTANFLQYKTVAAACCQFLRTQIEASNCLGVQQFAEVHSLAELEQAARDFALQNLVEVIKHQEFLQFSAPQLVEYIASEELLVKGEEMVYVAVMQWARHDPEVRLIDLGEVMTHVRLPLISSSFIKNIMENEPLVQASKTCQNLLQKAKVLQAKVQAGEEVSNPSLMPRPSMLTEILVVVGGMEHGRNWSQEVNCYNPREEAWFPLAPLPFTYTDYSVVAAGNYIYVTGGFKELESCRQTWRYSPATDKWDGVADLVVGRFNHASVAVGECAYVVGGESNDTALYDIEKYSPALDTWKLVGYTYVMESNLSVAAIGHRLYMVGWLTYEKSAAIQCYDLDTCECSVASITGLNRQMFPVVALGDCLYMLGSNRIKEVQVYHPLQEKVWQVAEMRTKRNHPSAVVMDGKIYVTGGEFRHYVDKVECYNPSTNMWSVVGPKMPKPVCFHGCVSLSKYMGPPYSQS